ncbi:hypothetical protein [Actinomadura keratinilytica]|jgi:hypothetical protein|uniref:Uncharacterized protein n=1 Tax=Actinomadura keratinilytica TaxID=547461 RepID=A0ABP7YNB9_9ACTN
MTKYRTRDGHKVTFGATVWAQNGTGPFTITEPGPAYGSPPKGWVLMIGADGEERLHAPEDISLYYYATKPV